jgi:UDP-GlcNAc:undecaprenyl-phosphate GlcNAc-1-phosphate transferase
MMVNSLNIAHSLLIALFSFLLSLSIGLILCKISFPKYFYDHPSSRKIHHIPTLNLGGFIIIISLIITSFLFGLFDNEDYRYYIVLCMVFFLIGFLDDIYNWNYIKKLTAQIIATLLFIVILQLDLSKIIFTSIDLQIPMLNYLLLTLFIVGVVNAFNFFDGINWLAGSLAIVILISYGILLNKQQLAITSSIYLILIFSILGFLVYNKSPAKMFLGDSGSNFLGFIMATLPLILLTNNSGPINVTISVILTSILTMEAVYLIFSRLKNKKNPFFADKNHLHHILLSIKLRSRYVVILISFSTIALSFLAYYSNLLLFYQVVLIEIVFFGIVIVLPRFIRPMKRYSLNSKMMNK